MLIFHPNFFINVGNIFFGMIIYIHFRNRKFKQDEINDIKLIQNLIKSHLNCTHLEYAFGQQQNQYKYIDQNVE